MTFQDQLNSIFVTDDQIPELHRLAGELNQREYLSNGEMRAWDGEVHTVVSPICIQTPEGLERKIIGTYPLCTEKEAMESLAAAEAAYNNGRGE